MDPSLPTKVVKLELSYNQTLGLVQPRIWDSGNVLLPSQTLINDNGTVTSVTVNYMRCGGSCYLEVDFVDPASDVAYVNYTLIAQSWNCREDALANQVLPVVYVVTFGSSYGPFTLCGFGR